MVGIVIDTWQSDRVRGTRVGKCRERTQADHQDNAKTTFQAPTRAVGIVGEASEPASRDPIKEHDCLPAGLDSALRDGRPPSGPCQAGSGELWGRVKIDPRFSRMVAGKRTAPALTAKGRPPRGIRTAKDAFIRASSSG